MGYGTIHESIFDSSVNEDWQICHVFVCMIVLAGESGVLDITRESLARRLNMPLRLVNDAIRNLESPDRSSRTPDHDGRRLIRLDEHRDWGWRLVNSAKYQQRLPAAEPVHPPHNVKPASFKGPSPRDLARIWNENCGHLPKVSMEFFDSHQARWTWAKARLLAHPDLSLWEKVVKRIAASPFCNGEVKGSPWRANFDFLVRRDTLAKVMEGKYDAVEQSDLSEKTAKKLLSWGNG